jgi:hypothetical protein
MASLSFTSNVLDEGTTFIFGSWMHVANSMGGFISHLVDSRKPGPLQQLDTATSTPSSTISMSCCSPICLGRSKTRPFLTRLQLVSYQDLDQIQTDLRRLRDPSPSLTWRRTWIASSRFKMREPPRIRGSPFSTTTLTQTKITRQLQLRKTRGRGSHRLSGGPSSRYPLVTR